MNRTPNLSLSHLQLRVDEVGRLERFYTEVFEFVVTERGEGTAAAEAIYVG